MDTQDPIVSAEWLLSNISAPDLRIVDATWFPSWTAGAGAGRRQYESGHIPGAVYFDIDVIADTSSDLPHMLPDQVKFSSHVRKLGLGDGHRIIIYDSNDFFASARVWWMFRVMGHRDVHVLDGGRRAWLRAGGELEDLPPMVTERHYTPRVRTDLVRTTQQVREASEEGSAKVLDARPAGRFAGAAPEPREGLASGHIPNSTNVPSASLVGSDGRLVPEEQLLKLLAPYRDEPVIATCGSGVSAAVIALALARLGNWDVAIYDGSWTQWASDPANPIKTQVS